MSTREKVINTISLLSDEQLEGLYRFLRGFFKDIPNDDTLASFAELEDMKQHPENYKSYTDLDEMFRDLEA